MAPLVLDPSRHAPATLAELRRSLGEELRELAAAPTPAGTRVVDPASLATVQELLASVLALLDRSPPDRPEDVAAEANLAYATLLAAIDLVKSHTDLPKVPPPRRSPAGAGGPARP